MATNKEKGEKMKEYNYDKYSYLDRLDTATLADMFNDLPLGLLRTVVAAKLDAKIQTEVKQ